jgi:RNA polymerase sigma-70 factor (ECF subfamily)
MGDDAAGGERPTNDARTSEVLRRALAGDVEALTQLVDMLTPVVHARTLRALARHRRGVDGRNARQELEDLAQDVFSLCFANDAKILRMWDPARGMSLANFVGLVTEREVTHTLRSGRRTPWSLVPTQDDELESILPLQEGAEATLDAKDVIDRTWTRLEAELTPRGLLLLRRLVIDEQPPEVVGAELGMTTQAVYSWKQRLLRRLRVLVTEMSSESVSNSEAAPRNPLGSSRR